MKFTVDVECTPQELRTVMGLPDVAPMQQAIMDELQERMLKSLDHLSPTGLVRDWFTTSSLMQKRLLDLVTNTQYGGAGTRGGASPEPEEPGSPGSASGPERTDRS